MKLPHLILALVSSLSVAGCKSSPPRQEDTLPQLHDPYLWLEEVEGPKALEFARTESDRTLKHFKSNPLFSSLEADIRAIIMAKDRLPGVTLKNGELYNFWQDDKHVRGLWRKTSLDSYATKTPKWETILDLDALAKEENENWVWQGASTLPPTHEKALIHLSRGGKDATVIREFSLKTKKFIPDGFHIPESKNHLTWKDENTVYVATDFGPGSMTNSGYPRISKVWKRGQALAEAKSIIEAKPNDMSVYSFVISNTEGHHAFHSIRKSFYEGQNWYEAADGQLIKIPMPDDVEFHGLFKGQLLFLLRSQLGQFKQGSLVSLALDKISMGDKAQKHLQLIFEPTDKKFIQYIATAKDYALVYGLDNVLSKIQKLSFTPPSNWKLEDVPLGENGMAYVVSCEDESNQYLAQYVDFLTPTSLYVGQADDKSNRHKLLKKSPERFDARGIKVERHEATSKDGTKIPYFAVYKESLPLNGKNPTLLYGYGGFESPMQPSYLGIIGKVWLERGGVYVLSNLRGGGEFGPAWHQSVLRENRYKVYEDNIAIAEDLIRRGITSPQHLGISGRSNGGLLTGATFTTRPELFNAVIVGVPLLDMLRYHKLLAGASWMDEYGDPEDPKMRDAILKYSPYQRLRAEVKYPEVLIMTSTKDDRVHPGHARKMVARMKEQGHSVYYYENIEGGHAGSANLEQSILWNALEYTYLWEKLK